MKDNSVHSTRRRRFLTGMGVVATGAAVAATAQTVGEAGTGKSAFTPTRHDEDAWMDTMSGGHRAFIDSSTGAGGIAAMNYANNMLSAHADAYDGSDADYGMIVCFRHESSPFGFNDAMWDKYGELFIGRTRLGDDDSGGRPRYNPLNIERYYGNRSNTINALRDRGVHYAICNLSTRGMAGQLARASGSSTADVYQELVENSIPQSRFVPAGVVAATRAQEYGFSLLYAG